LPPFVFGSTSLRKPLLPKSCDDGQVETLGGLLPQMRGVIGGGERFPLEFDNPDNYF